MALRGLQLFLLSSALALHSSAQSDAQSSLDATSDGSGSAPYRSSPSFLLFAIQSIVLGVFLLSWGKRSWKVGTALGLGLAFELVTWVAIVNTVGAEGFSASSRNAADLILWGAVTAVGVFGAVLGATKLFWMLGTVAMAGCGGMAFSLSVIMMGDNDLPGIARWIILGVSTLAGALVGPFFQATWGMALTMALAGSFLLFLGIDLLVNATDGMSLGLRYLFDGNASHAIALQSYHPSVSTRVLLACIWIFAALSTGFQCWMYRDSPFVRTFDSLHAHTNRDADLDLTTSPTPPLTELSQDSIAARIQQRYQHASYDEKASFAESPKSGTRLLRGSFPGHAQELSSPDEPPSRPSSVCSTTLADGLRSRPPTFFNEPLRPSSPPPRLPVVPSSDYTFEIPIAAVGAAAASRSVPELRRDSAGIDQDGRLPGEGTARKDSGASKASEESRKSWRKPVPILVEPVPQSNEGGKHMVERRVDRGFLSGAQASLAPTGSTPSSDGSMLLGSSFGRLQDGRPDPASNPPTLRTDTSSFPVLHAPQIPVHSPELVSAPFSHSSFGERTDGTQSFLTALSEEADSVERRTPDLVRNDMPSEAATSVASPGASPTPNSRWKEQ